MGYSLTFILGCYNSVQVYSTGSTAPLFVLKDIHYASLSDLSWRSCGNVFVVSSIDGFLTFGKVSSDVVGRVLSEEETKEILPDGHYLKTDEFRIQRDEKFSVVHKVQFVRKSKD